MREYEVMVIVDPDADPSAVDAAVDRVTRVLTERGGEVVNVDRWGRRRLAYEIARKTEGVYVVVRFKAAPEAIEELERLLVLADEVIRHKVVKRERAA